MPTEHRFYGDLAPWWPLISPPEEYVEEAGFAMTLVIFRSRCWRCRDGSTPSAITGKATCEPSGWAGRSTRSSFGRDVWLRLLADAGFEPEAVTEQTSEDRIPRQLFVGHRPHGPDGP